MPGLEAGWRAGRVCTFAGKGAAEGVEGSPEALPPPVGKRPQTWSGITGTRLVPCPWTEAGRWLCERAWEGIMKPEGFVIFNFLKQRAPSRKKKRRERKN